jgi:hypothetical protein
MHIGNTSSRRAIIVLAITATFLSTLASMTMTSVNAQLFQPFPGSQSPQQKFFQLRQNFAMLEQRLMQMPPQQQQFMISTIQQQLMNGFAQLPPQAVPQAIQIMQQAMSPQLAQVILAPVVAQLQNGPGSFGGSPSLSTTQAPGQSSPRIPPGINNAKGLNDACLSSGFSQQKCENMLFSKNPGGYCTTLKIAGLPCPQIQDPAKTYNNPKAAIAESEARSRATEGAIQGFERLHPSGPNGFAKSFGGSTG